MHTMHTAFSIVHPSDGTDGLRTCPQKRTMTVRQEWVGMVADVVAESEASLGALSQAVKI